MDYTANELAQAKANAAIKAAETPLADVAGLVERLRKVMEASRREDGSLIPLGEELRQAADALEAQARQIANLTASINTLNEQSERLATELSEARRQLAERDAEIARLRSLVIQYRDDLRHPPAPDSKERRLEAINLALGGVA